MARRIVLGALMPCVTSVFATAVVTASLMSSTDGQVSPVDSNGVLTAYEPESQPCVWTALEALNQALAEASACGSNVRGEMIISGGVPR